MGVVAPISATAAVVPVVVGIATGDRPSALQYAGLVLALVGVVLASREEVGGRCGARAAPGSRCVSALGFGFFFVGMDNASDADVGWAMLVNRVTSVSLLLAAFARAAAAARGPARRTCPVLALVGTLDIAANAHVRDRRRPRAW